MNNVLMFMELMLSLCGGVGGVCTVIFVSTPSLTDLDWTVRLDWSLTIECLEGRKIWLTMISSLATGKVYPWCKRDKLGLK